MESLFYLSAGAVAGALARFAFTHFSSQWTGHHGFPYGTLAVNVIGSFAVGYVLTWTVPGDRWRLLTATGFCGAFTTFSAFAFESVRYLQQGRAGLFVANVLLNNVLSLLAVLGGIALHRRMG